MLWFLIRLYSTIMIERVLKLGQQSRSLLPDGDDAGGGVENEGGDGVGDNDDDDVDDVEKSQQGLTEVRRPERNTGPQKDRC